MVDFLAKGIGHVASDAVSTPLRGFFISMRA
jgi:hypothetical protein